MMLRDRRRRVLGVPIGRRHRRSMPTAGWAGAGLAAAAASVPIAHRAGRAVSHGRDLVNQGRDVVNQGKDMAGQAGQAVDTAKQFKEAVSSHSTTIGKVGAVVNQARKLGKSGGGEGKPRLAHLIEEHTDIAVPRSVAYNQWTQLEMFPALVKGVEAVDQQQDDKAEWTSKIGPVRRHWPARITEQIPDERIAWRSEGGPTHRGAVSFHSLDDQLTRVLVQMQYKPSGPLETVGNTLRIQRRRVRRDLRLFKHFLEMEGEPTGEWRGRIGDSDGEGDDRKSDDNRKSDDDRRGGGSGRAQSRARRRDDDSQHDEDASRNGNGSAGRRSRASATGPARRTRSQDDGNGAEARPTRRRSSTTNGQGSSSGSERKAARRPSATGRKGGQS